MKKIGTHNSGTGERPGNLMSWLGWPFARCQTKTLREQCLAEMSEEQKKDFAAMYSEHISKDAALKAIVDHTELGCNLAFMRLMAIAGATLRVETPPPASATAGSSQSDLDSRVFERTVPKDLR